MSLLAHNASPLERQLEHVCDPRLDPGLIRGVADSTRCPPALLPWLAWAMKVDGWEAATSESQQRALIREAIPVHRSKGSVAAVRRALQAVQVHSELKEWWQVPGAAPYTFQLTAWANDNRMGEGAILSPQLYTRLRNLVNAVKNERSHYDFRLGAGFTSGLRLANANFNRCVARHVATLQGVPLTPGQGLLIANLSRPCIVVRGRMEAVI
ncbi:phage tail protein I [Pseudomonas carassii]|uniref:Phage tail protein I n=1 Tax=Pseudomonas carassii TaxID=3115855 RepID=A0ABU7HB28_9PSED|nr:phage tail protein I [Pseudomonas sp. 137P]MEE1888499.1 phage tail protein I [Pseudomonas sp. 137P]